MRKVFYKDDFRRTVLSFMHLTPPSYNLSARNYQIIRKLYQMLDYTQKGLDDVVIRFFLEEVFKDKVIKKKECEFIFNLFDTNLTSTIDFDEFYLLIQILIAIRDRQIRQFFNANTRVCFDLLDSDCLGMITNRQQRELCFLLNMDKKDVIKKFNDHDTSKNEALDFEEFKILVQDCLDNADDNQKGQDDDELPLGDDLPTEPKSNCSIV
ncbi:EF-hand calcium-binding domain-containing protein 9 [Tritrichomonas musculus]|uniref:EF-hand calcium-binding domain-containing protein 9 n=1 Tax=Tritrichomonas musculus TaxID=1915356 RepID=A0ABR2JE79_9EUKA